MTITICGGGSLGHVCLGVLSSIPDVDVNLFTSQPDRWDKQIIIIDPEGETYYSHIHTITSEPSLVIPDADIILLCLPGFAIEKALLQIKPYISSKSMVGSVVSSTGFFFIAHSVLGVSAKLFGFQRVPFIARTNEYGHSANLLGYKSELAVAFENIEDRDSACQVFEHLFNLPVRLLESYYEASLTNSNPLLHTSRLYEMWHDWDGRPFDRCILFYKEWTEEAAQLLIEMDREFFSLLNVLPITKISIPTILDYYESFDAKSLCEKLKSIKAFENISAPMKMIAPNLWVPDFQSRYFTEDFPHGLRYIVDLANEYRIETPLMNKIFRWGINKINCQ